MQSFCKFAEKVINIQETNWESFVTQQSWTSSSAEYHSNITHYLSSADCLFTDPHHREKHDPGPGALLGLFEVKQKTSIYAMKTVEIIWSSVRPVYISDYKHHEYHQLLIMRSLLSHRLTEINV